MLHNFLTSEVQAIHFSQPSYKTLLGRDYITPVNIDLCVFTIAPRLLPESEVRLASFTQRVVELTNVISTSCGFQLEHFSDDCSLFLDTNWKITLLCFHIQCRYVVLKVVTTSIINKDATVESTTFQFNQSPHSLARIFGIRT